MYDISLKENKINFKMLEAKIYKYTCDAACRIMKYVLEKLDDKLMQERDNKVYRDKGKKHTCIKTIMGDVEIDRRIYKYETEDGKTAYKYLLDEYLGIDVIGHMSVNLVEKILDNAAEVSYRKNAKNIKEMCNQEISHTAAWNVVQNVGRKIKEKEDRKIILNKNGELNGKKKVKVLFQERDGIWLNIQDKNKSKKGKNKKKELKLGISYEGFEKRKGTKDQYAVKNKIVYASFKNTKKFEELSDASASEIYDMNSIKARIVNGDGAGWIKAGTDEERVYYQLDPFHKSQAVIRNVRSKKDRKKLIKMLNEGKVSESLEMVTQMMVRDRENKEDLKKLEKLYNYLVNNKKGLKPYNLQVKLPDPPPGVTYRHAGTMEHNICDILAQRMKGRKMSWSVDGAENLAKILAEKFSRRLYKTVEELYSSLIPESKLKKIIKTADLSAADVNVKASNCKIYKVPHGQIPYINSDLTPGRKAIRNIFNYVSFSNMQLK
mgnify:CR=1 FL=1